MRSLIAAVVLAGCGGAPREAPRLAPPAAPADPCAPRASGAPGPLGSFLGADRGTLGPGLSAEEAEDGTYRDLRDEVVLRGEVAKVWGPPDRRVGDDAVWLNQTCGTRLVVSSGFAVQQPYLPLALLVGEGRLGFERIPLIAPPPTRSRQPTASTSIPSGIRRSARDRRIVAFVYQADLANDGTFEQIVEMLAAADVRRRAWVARHHDDEVFVRILVGDDGGQPLFWYWN